MEEVVIVGAGIAGLATSLSLHRLGIRSLVLESSECLRTTGFALGMWPNGWKALDAIGIAHILRQKHTRFTKVITTSVDSGVTTSERTFAAPDSEEYIESRCLLRKEVLETLASELPKDAIRYSSKVVHIESNDRIVSVHLTDGTVLKTKVLIGGDGVNSVVSKYLGLSIPCSTARSAVRGIVYYEQGHGFEPHIMQFFGKGVRFGVVPCDDHSIYWGLTFCPSSKEKELVEDPIELKELVLSKLGRAPEKIKQVFERSELKNMVCAPLRFRHPWEMLWGNINRANICVVGDALHPMTPDLAQGGCSALEESVVLARLLAKAFKGDDKDEEEEEEEEEHQRIGKAMDEFARGRRWRSFDLIATAYFVGFMQQSDGVVMHFLRDKLMAKFLAGLMLKKASFDCGKLVVS